MEREKREKNAIMFNVPESDSEENEDVSYFKALCLRTLELDPIPDVRLSRIGAKVAGKQRPIKISFEKSWDKRKFLSSLFKLSNNERYKKIRVAHDMCEDDRADNKRLLKEAYELNVKETPTNFKYKVRGPPWDLKITKVFAKNS